MERIFVDTNIVLDLLLSRKPHFQDTAVLFSKADKKELKLSVSVLTITTAHYILSKHLNKRDTKEVLRKLKLLILVLPLEDKIINLSHWGNSDMSS